MFRRVLKRRLDRHKTIIPIFNIQDSIINNLFFKESKGENITMQRQKEEEEKKARNIAQVITLLIKKPK